MWNSNKDLGDFEETMAIVDGDENDNWGLMSESNFPRMIPKKL